MPERSEFEGNGDNCPNCKSTDLRYFGVESHDDEVPVPFTVYACNDCDFAWQWPRPRTSEASKTYFESEYEAERDGTYFGSESRRKIAEMEFSFLATRVEGPASVLDLGGGDGIFCDVAAENGWSATCVDPALPASKISEGNPRFVKGLPDDLNETELFDVVTLWDVIEHVETPVEVLQSAMRHVKPGGYLFVETGNFQSCGRIEAGSDWWCYQSDHRWYFSPPVMDGLMKDIGLENIHVHDGVLRPWWSGAKSAIIPGPHSVITSTIRRPLNFSANLTNYLELRKGAKKWPEWSGIEIFAMYGRRPG